METIKLDLIPGKKMPSLHASQYDDGRDYHIDLTENRVPYVLDGTETISLTVRKCDNTLVTMDVANVFGGKSYIEFRTTEQMNACAGFNYGEITIEKNGTQISSLNFYLQVEGAPDEGGIQSQSEINNLARQVHDIVVEELEDHGASDTGYDNTESGLEATNVQDAIDEVNTKIENIPSVDAYTKEQSDEKYATKSELADKADVSAIPTKTSQLQNDSGFAQIDDTEASASKTYSSDKIDALLGKKADIVVNKYLTKTPVQTYSGYRMSYTTEGQGAGLCYISIDAIHNCKAYKVTAGETYKIQAYGYDVDSFYIGAIGEDLVSSGQTTPTLQPILCGGSTYPTDYTNHIVEFTAQYTGYLYLNERPSTGVSAYAKGNEQIDVRNENGLIIKDGKYTHFVYLGEGNFLIREFKRRGPNNLFQLVHVGIGYFANGTYVETKSFMTASTDIIGPFSIDKVGWSGGVWTGGNHSVTVDDVACPTAEQLSLSVTANNKAVSDNGTYYGDIKIIAKNKLYFAQTITGNTFEGATPAILETRLYNLTDTMNVEVYIELLDDVRFSKYHGMQYVNSNVVNVVIPDDETVIALADLSSDYSMAHKQPDIILQYADGEELHMILNRSGLGSYAHNNGNDNYGFIATYGKTYHTLISNTSIANGKKLYWSGEYKMIV